MGLVQIQPIKENRIAEIRSESELASLACFLAGTSSYTTACNRQTGPESSSQFDPQFIAAIRRQIASGADPLGEIFCRLRSPETRRASGATYTPPSIVRSMLAWAVNESAPARIVDPGSGSGRFLFAAAQRFPNAALIAVETDPLALLMLRANAAVLGVTSRLSIQAADYRQIVLPEVAGPTLFLGNPPYVRHHDIPKSWKTWFAKTAAEYGFRASKLAGLHIHFFLKTRQLARDGDYGAFITSAEWLDVHYGDLLRKMLADGLGGTAVHVLAPHVSAFDDAFTTGAITCFRIGRQSTNLHLRTIGSLDDLDAFHTGRPVPWIDLVGATRWSPIVRAVPKPPSGFIELGELFSVHRGQVTGANSIWTVGNCPVDLPQRFLRPTVTKARELFAAGSILISDSGLRRIIDLPFDLDQLHSADREQIDRFLAWARHNGADQSYVARHRRAWWAVSLYDSAPILCTYMARRPPTFVRNLCRARHLNIAHGLYPRKSMTDSLMMAIIEWLRTHVTVDAGRTYAGGLTKFEPRELERVHIPRLENLQATLKVNEDSQYTQNTASLG
jgi:hypothetical protein